MADEETGAPVARRGDTMRRAKGKWLRERTAGYIVKWAEAPNCDWRLMGRDVERYEQRLAELHALHLRAVRSAPLGLSGCNVPYSVNKRRRWDRLHELTDVGAMSDVAAGVYVETDEVHVLSAKLLCARHGWYVVFDYGSVYDHSRSGHARATHRVDEFANVITAGATAPMAHLRTLRDVELRPKRANFPKEVRLSPDCEFLVRQVLFEPARYPKSAVRWARRVDSTLQGRERDPAKLPKMGAEWPVDRTARSKDDRRQFVRDARKEQRKRVDASSNRRSRRPQVSQAPRKPPPYSPAINSLGGERINQAVTVTYAIATPTKNTKVARRDECEQQAQRRANRLGLTRAVPVRTEDTPAPRRNKLLHKSNTRSYLKNQLNYADEVAYVDYPYYWDESNDAHDDAERSAESGGEVSLADFVVQTGKGVTFKKHRPSKIVRRRGTSVMDKPWLDRISRSTEDYVIVEETSEAGTSAGDSGISGRDSPIVDLAARDPFSVMHVRVFDEQIEPSELWYHYRDLYYECSCLPRRFCVDITPAVQRILTLNYGSGAKSKCRTCATFEVAPAGYVGRNVMRKFFDDSYDWHGDSDEEHTAVSVWLNTDADMSSGKFSLYDVNVDNANKPMHLNEVLQSLALTVGLLPNEFFVTVDDAESVRLGQNTEKGTICLLPKTVSPGSYCLVDQDEAHFAAMRQNDFAKRLQRQLTAVKDYTEPAIQYYPPRSTRVRNMSMMSAFSSCSSAGDDQCAICLEDISTVGECMALAQCRHWFCNACWRMHVAQCLRIRKTPVLCPASGCDTVLDYDTACTVVTLRLCDRYATLLGQRHVQRSKTWRYCPGRDCNRVLVVNPVPQPGAVPYAPVRCPCGATWCLNCEERPHWPVDCDRHKLYCRKLRNNGHLDTNTLVNSDRVVQARRCPHCGTLMERSDGCNHMSCSCGGQFCYLCGTDWTGNHYRCKEASMMEKVRLIDVDALTSQLLSDRLYVRCVEHRLAAAKPDELLAAPKRTGGNRAGATKAVRRRTAAAAPQCDAHVTHGYVMAHKVCEYALLWSQFYLAPNAGIDCHGRLSAIEKRKERKMVAFSLRREVERIEFLLKLLEYKCSIEQKFGMDELVKKIDKKSKSILSRMTILIERH